MLLVVVACPASPLAVRLGHNRAVHTIQTTDASIVCADGHFADTKCTCTTLSFFLDQFLGLLDGLSCCHYGGHLAAAVVLVVVWGLLNDDDGDAKGSVLQLCQVFHGTIGRCRLMLYVCASTDSTKRAWQLSRMMRLPCYLSC
jgi:hypothetical protein